MSHNLQHDKLGTFGKTLLVSILLQLFSVSLGIKQLIRICRIGYLHLDHPGLEIRKSKIHTWRYICKFYLLIRRLIHEGRIFGDLSIDLNNLVKSINNIGERDQDILTKLITTSATSSYNNKNTSPATGEYRSDAAFTLSTAPKEPPAVSFFPTAGRSTNTTSPSWEIIEKRLQ
jgi:hypothetical protein